LQLIDFDYEVYVKIEDHYRREKELVREELLKGRDKKIPLPPCNPDYPVCFHRIEMEKRLGCI
jgi:adenine C2-methylase RlmN of 23S rRNA A2503 and tRNA A37